MALDPGTRIGPYKVTDQLGVGGMGEVYRATDTKLKRQVALKVLPASLASDHDRLARFQHGVPRDNWMIGVSGPYEIQRGLRLRPRSVEAPPR